MTREDAEDYIKFWCPYSQIKAIIEALSCAWIPIKTRPLTEEERQYYFDRGFSEDEIAFMYDCPLPDDGQEVLVTDIHGNVETDVFCHDEGCFFETNCDDGEVLAWMPLPKPYKAESEEQE